MLHVETDLLSFVEPVSLPLEDLLLMDKDVPVFLSDDEPIMLTWAKPLYLTHLLG